jgi:hypothetical protein
MCYFPVKFIDDQQIGAFKHRTLDPCVDERESVRVETTTPRFVTTVQRDLYFVTAQQMLHVHIASTSTMPVCV